MLTLPSNTSTYFVSNECNINGYEMTQGLFWYIECVYLLANTFYMVSNTKNKNSENLNFHQICCINYEYDR